MRIVVALATATLSCGTRAERAPPPPATDRVCVDPTPSPSPSPSAGPRPDREAVSAFLHGSRKRGVVLDNEQVDVEELARLQTCVPPPDAALAARVSRAKQTFFAKKELRDRGTSTPWLGVGCEEHGELLVSLALGLGVGEVVEATYLVDERRARLLVDGTTIAHADLDGDGRRDVIWAAPTWIGAMPGHRVVIRFADRGRQQRTAVTWSMAEDSDSFGVGAPALGDVFALVVVYDSESGTSIQERLLWNGRAFAPVPRLDDAFEARFMALTSGP
jgi:hypothetical protein